MYPFGSTPAGVVTARPRWENGRVQTVAFKNVPSFVFTRGETVTVERIGDVRFDLAFGGAFYAFCDIDQFGIGLGGDHFNKLVDLGRRIKHAVAAQHDVNYPDDDDLGFLYGTTFTGPPRPGEGTAGTYAFLQMGRSIAVQRGPGSAHDLRSEDPLVKLT